MFATELFLLALDLRSRVAVFIDDPIFHAIMLIALTRLGIVTISGKDKDSFMALSSECGHRRQTSSEPRRKNDTCRHELDFGK